MDGKFDEQVLQKLLTRLSNSFTTYAPDKSVMDYLNQHSSSLHWEKKLDFRTPREKQSQDTRPSKQEKRKDRPDKRADRSKERTGRNRERNKRPDRASDRKRLKTSRSDPGFKPRIPESEQCRRPTCRERGNHLNHSHAKCRFANASTRHPNLGKAPGKKIKPAGESDQQRAKRAHKPAATAASASTSNEKRLCYICSSPDHLANACPQKEQNKSRARKTLTKGQKFHGPMGREISVYGGETMRR